MTRPCIVRFHSDLVKIYPRDRLTGDEPQMFEVKGPAKGQGHSVT